MKEYLKIKIHIYSINYKNFKSKNKPFTFDKNTKLCLLSFIIKGCLIASVALNLLLGSKSSKFLRKSINKSKFSPLNCFFFIK